MIDRDFQSMRTMEWELFIELDCALLVHGTEAPSDDDWSGMLAAYTAWAKPIHDAGRRVLCLIWSPHGTGPNAKQRGELDDAHRTLRPRAAVATGSVMGRGIVTAIAWLGNTEIRAFHPKEIDAAFEYLGISHSGGKHIQERLRALEAGIR